MVVYITFLFGTNTSLRPIRTHDGSVTFDPSEMAKVLSTISRRKQYDQVLNLPTCFINLTYFAFKSSEIKYYLKELNSNGGSDPDNVYFIKNTAYLFFLELAKFLCCLLVVFIIIS